jgi:hypothetical protein
MKTRRGAALVVVVAGLVAVFAADTGAQKQENAPEDRHLTGMIRAEWRESLSKNEEADNGQIKWRNERIHRSTTLYTYAANGACSVTGKWLQTLTRLGHDSRLKEPLGDWQKIEEEWSGKTNSDASIGGGYFSPNWDGKYSLNPRGFGGKTTGSRIATSRHLRRKGKMIEGPTLRLGPGGMSHPSAEIQATADPKAALLAGSKTISLPIEKGWEGTSTLTVIWKLSRKPVQNLEVVVDIPDYNTWVPRAGRSTDDGGDWPLLVQASLRTKDGSPVTEKASKFTFELASVSHEPGICMNYPAPTNSPNEPPDLQFALSKGLRVVDEQGKEGGQRLRAETLPGSYTSAEALIGCYDWGAYGELVVTAEMPDGRLIIGYPKWYKTDPSIRLPKRQPGSRIADAWKEQWKAQVPKIFELPDDDDSEDDTGRFRPPGPGICPGDLKCPGGDKGDGLTLYEEYRGFYVGGEHEQGDPSKKDLFIFNEYAGCHADAAVMHFQNLTSSFLNVHDGLDWGEIGPERIIRFDKGQDKWDEIATGPIVTRACQVWINPNVGDETPTHGKQYGINVFGNDEVRDVVEGLGHPGTPKIVSVGQDFYRRTLFEFRTGEGQVLSRDFSRHLIVHGLLRCCNVANHGDGDRWVTWRLDPQELGNYKNLIEEEAYAKGTPARTIIPLEDVRWKDGKPVARDKLIKWLDEGNRFGKPFLVARPGGEHSGYQDCVMRYCVALAFIRQDLGTRVRVLPSSPTDPDDAYDKFELIGESLCNQRDDTTVGQLNLPPLGRYGPAKYGFCRSQICINDTLHPHLFEVPKR